MMFSSKKNMSLFIAFHRFSRIFTFHELYMIRANLEIIFLDKVGGRRESNLIPADDEVSAWLWLSDQYETYLRVESRFFSLI